MGVFFLLYILTFIFTGNLSKMPVVVAFLAASMVALLLCKGNINTRVNVFCRGASNDTLLLMVVIFILAGAFAGSANAMGAVDATVNAILYLLPKNMIPASLFVAACLVSMAMGTSCGTIAALAPIAVGIAPQAGISIPAVVGIVVGGSMFGDNLSYISDTTIVVTRTQGVRMKDKFLTNIRIVIPAAVIAILIYVVQGYELTESIVPASISWIKILPYAVVLITALAGVNVMVVLAGGTLLAGIVGLCTADVTVWQWMAAANKGIVNGMGELIIVSLLAGGMFEVIRHSGGIDWLVGKLTRNARTPRRAEGSMAALTVLTNLCTANNTVALMIVSPIARKIAEACHINRRRVAGLLDTVSCFAQGLLPYGAQLLIASGLAGGINPMSIVPHLYYPMLIGVAALLAIVLQYPRGKKQVGASR
ncbi:sodium:proton antiporter [Bacteroidia bacterium]|nr:sodium:proton antiporter [Bacteroidia bacterium]